VKLIGQAHRLPFWQALDLDAPGRLPGQIILASQRALPAAAIHDQITLTLQLCPHGKGLSESAPRRITFVNVADSLLDR